MDYLRQQTLALLGQEFLSQALSSGGSLNSVVADILVHPKPKTGKEIVATALTGRIRSDSAVLRQGSKNASEAAAMAGMIKTATLSVGETLNAMQTIVQSVRNKQMTADAATPEYMSLASKLTATIESTNYNGIALLDNSRWAGDGRLAVSGGTATLPIQMGNSAATCTIRDISAMKNLAAVNLAADDATLDGYLENIVDNIATANTMASGYESLAGSYTGEARYLEQQADTLALAAEKAQPGGTLFPETGDPESALKRLLVTMVVRDQGKVIDTAS